MNKEVMEKAIIQYEREIKQLEKRLRKFNVTKIEREALEEKKIQHLQVIDELKNELKSDMKKEYEKHNPEERKQHVLEKTRPQRRGVFTERKLQIPR